MEEIQDEASVLSIDSDIHDEDNNNTSIELPNEDLFQDFLSRAFDPRKSPDTFNIDDEEGIPLEILEAAKELEKISTEMETPPVTPVRRQSTRARKRVQ